MPIPQTFHGTVYQIPVQGDLHWAPPLTRYLVALGTYAMTSTGGSYTLTGDLNLGNAFGVIAKYFTSGSTLPSTVGSLRLANLDTIGWRNFANSGNLLLAVNASNQLTFDGSPIQPLLSLMDGQIWIGDGTNTPIGRTLTGDVTVNDTGVTAIGALKITNAMVSNSAAIAYGKLALTGSIVNTDIYSAAAIAYSKLSLSNSIVNADIATAAAIAYSKLAALTANRVLLSDGSGFVSASSISNTTLGFLDATSSIQTQLNGKLTTTLADTKIWVGNGSNIATAVNLSADATLADTGALTLTTVNSNVGSFTLASITVDAKGRITAASSGSAGAGTVTSVSGTTNQINVATGTTTPVLSISSTFVFPGTISANSHKITSLTNGSAASDAAAFGQIPVITAGQIVGTATNDAASAGNVGEYVSSSATADANSSATTVWDDLTSISLTAGDWDVSCYVRWDRQSNVWQIVNAGISSTSGNSSTGLVIGINQFTFEQTSSAVTIAEVPAQISNYRVLLASTTTIYLKRMAVFAAGLLRTRGYMIQARRRR